MSHLNWVLASGNPGKLGELRTILAPYPVELVSLAQMGIDAEAPETADSFMGNALMKAEFYYQRLHMPVLADDSGLVIDALAGAPGVHSARFGGFATHAEKRTHVLHLMRDIPPAKRTARFACAAVYWDGQRCEKSLAHVDGFITLAERGSLGFGYDPIFCLEWGGATTAELGPAEKNAISHRGKAFRELVLNVLGQQS